MRARTIRLNRLESTRTHRGTSRPEPRAEADVPRFTRAAQIPMQYHRTIFAWFGSYPQASPRCARIALETQLVIGMQIENTEDVQTVQKLCCQAVLDPQLVFPAGKILWVAGNCQEISNFSKLLTFS